MYCKNCGKEIDDKAYVCVHCGARTDNPAVIPKGKFCSNCGLELDKYASECPRCGVKVSDRKRPMFGMIAIISFVLSFINFVFVGAVVAAYGIMKANAFGDKKGLKYNIAALIYSIIVSIITLSVNLIL